MIEVNLLPGGKKRSSRGGGLPFKLPALGGGGLPTDPYLLGAIGAGVVALGVIGYLFSDVRSDQEEIQVAVDEAVQDSSRFADLIARTNQLTARRDSIAQRVEIIQQIDQGRYTWPHIMDEIARALPDYTWLTEIIPLGAEPLEIQIVGNAGSNFAVTAFMRQLEASPFLRGVDLRSSQQSRNANTGDFVYGFDLAVTFEPPGLDQVETMPLFEAEVSSQMAVPDSAGG